MKNQIFKIFLLASLCFMQASSRSEDIDLFAGVTASGTAPNLLLVIDNAANFGSNASPASAGTCTIGGATNSLVGTVGGIEQCALHAVINSMAVSDTAASLNIGVMVFNGSNVVTSTNDACPASGNGGCLVYPMMPLTTTNRASLLSWIRSWKISNGGNDGGSLWIKGTNSASGAAMQESWAFFAGKTGLSGKDYSALKPSVGCSNNFIIYIGNSYSNSGTPGDPTSGPEATLKGTYGTALMNASPAASDPEKTLLGVTSSNAVTACGTASIPMGNTHENKGFYADEWSRYMYANSQTITYTIGILGDSKDCSAEYAWLLNSMAAVGGGKYFPTNNYAALETAFGNILSEVQSTNSAFASVSLPVSVNTQGTYLNQVFIGMFRPDADSLPRWDGNLKQYKMGVLNGSLRMLDANTTPTSAISASGTDFIAECARSFWTPALSDADNYWNFNIKANCAGYAASSNTPDGNMVEKGGQAYMLRSMAPASRTVKTCSPVFASCTTLTSFDTANTAGITDILLGSSGSVDTSTTVTRTTLVNWARGLNNKTLPSNGEAATVASTSMRPSVHGDVVHSRPVAVNFGSDAIPKVVVFYGGNDGVLRAINGNRPDRPSPAFTVGSTSIAAGNEFWSFIPPEFYGSLKRLYNNTSSILVRDGTGATKIAGTAKNYGMDGTVVGYVDTASATRDAWIYATMRRGGRALYAFKVDGSTLAVTLKWKRGCGINSTTDSSITACTNDVTNGDFRDIGQTWGSPKIIKSSGYGSGALPLLVMGGGYDAACEDALSYTCATTTGNRIYVMDADNGVLKRTFTTDRGVTGDVVFIKDSGGMVTYGYAADLGGNVYRISGSTANVPIGSTAPGSWTITKIASLGCSTVTTCTSPANRKFIFGPDVTVDGANNILLLGSGDREKPLNTANTTSNYFFKINDKPTDTSYLTAESANCPVASGLNVMCLNSLLPVTSGTIATTASLAAKKGWYLALQSNEQVVTSAVTVYGAVYFSTHQPKAADANSCSANLGNTRSYNVLYTSGANPDGSTNAPFTLFTGGGLPPSPVAGKVTLDDGTTVPFIIGAKGRLETMQLTGASGTSNPAKIRSYWYIQK